jgi:hypothetical protein
MEGGAVTTSVDLSPAEGWQNREEQLTVSQDVGQRYDIFSTLQFCMEILMCVILPPPVLVIRR